MSENWLLKVLNSEQWPWERVGKVVKRTPKAEIDYYNKIGLPEVTFCGDQDREETRKILAGHIRSVEEFFTQVLCWLLKDKRFKVFRNTFLEKIFTSPLGEDIVIEAEVPEKNEGKKNSRYDIAIYKKLCSPENLIAIVECKIKNQDFRSLERYHNALKKNKSTNLVTLTYLKHESDGFSSRQLYWHQIYKMLEYIDVKKVKEDVQEVFRRYNLDCKYFSEGFDSGKRREIIGKIQLFLASKCEESDFKPNTYGVDNKVNFCTLVIYNGKSHKRVRKDGARNLYATPSFAVALDGFMIRGYQDDLTFKEPLSIRVQVFSKRAEHEDEKAKEICDYLRKKYKDNWDEIIGSNICFEKTYNFPWRDEELEDYLNRLIVSLDARYEEWKEAFNECHQKSQ